MENKENTYENTYIRDVIHKFIDLSPDELKLVDTPQFQRLRDINQLSFTHLVYPGATHKRFEHSLGVMHVAGMMFDIMLDKHNLDPKIKSTFSKQLQNKAYWRQTLRLAALCHDLGHLPFSHTLEKWVKERAEYQIAEEMKKPQDSRNQDKIAEMQEYAKDKLHEHLTRKIIEEELADIIKTIKVKAKDEEERGTGTSESSLNPQEIAFLAVSDKVYECPSEIEGDDLVLVWLKFLRSIITSDFFGADRIDYLLRDAYHAGVPYGQIDIHQLLRSLELKAKNQRGHNAEQLLITLKTGPGLAMVVAFLVARQLMYTQVYQHNVSKIYDLHLEDFVGDWMDTKHKELQITLKDLVSCSDSDIMNMLNRVVRSKKKYEELQIHTDRLLLRQHFKLVRRLDIEQVIKLYSSLSKGQKYEIGEELDKDAETFFEVIKAALNAQFGGDEKVVKFSYKRESSERKYKDLLYSSDDDIDYATSYHNDRYSNMLRVLLTSQQDRRGFEYCYLYARPDKLAKIDSYLRNLT